MRELRKIYGVKRDEVTGDWRKVRNEELRGPYSSPNIIQMMKSRRMRWKVGTRERRRDRWRGRCEHGNERSVSTKYGVYLD
jgi:hypothetical protein